MQALFKKTILISLIPLMAASILAQDEIPMSDSMARALVQHNADSLLNGPWFTTAAAYRKGDSTEIRKVEILRKPNRIRLYAGNQLAFAPFREEVVDSLLRGIGSGLSEPYSGHQVELFAGKDNILSLVPNYHRTASKSIDKGRSPGSLKRKSPPLVTRVSKPWLAGSSLYNINLALWHSHGWYYEPKLNRWEWQRARLFQTVEDIYPLAYTLPFLVPMLENAGANVFIPRERDWQVHEVLVDNNGSSGNSLYVAGEHLEESSTGTGFAIGNTPYVEENPFRQGSFHSMLSAREASEMIQWIPDIPKAGDYAVYIAFKASAANANDALYRVHHLGGVSEFRINQQMGGSTWVYLGRFSFGIGLNPAQGSVVLSNQGDRRGMKITADAVKFGGGMGNISRNGLTSQRPRYQEGARYYLQYAGMPDSLVWRLNEANDYNDDYQSRGEWVNYLVGAPSGPLVNRRAKGLGIPVDLAFAFHTDAGITDNDTVIGTLGIYSRTYDKGRYPAGLVTNGLPRSHRPDTVTDRGGSEGRSMIRPGPGGGCGTGDTVKLSGPMYLPCCLNFFLIRTSWICRFGQEPMFRFHVSRAIYKGMLRFLSSQNGTPYTVQPLPVDHLRTELLPEGGMRLSWEAVTDPLEPSAGPDSYLVYTRMEGGGFDNGTARGRLQNTSWKIPGPMSYILSKSAR